LDCGLYLKVYAPVAVVTAVAAGTGAPAPILAFRVTVTPLSAGVPGTRLAILPLIVTTAPGFTDAGVTVPVIEGAASRMNGGRARPPSVREDPARAGTARRRTPQR